MYHRFLVSMAALVGVCMGAAAQQPPADPPSEGGWEMNGWERSVTFRGLGRDDINYTMYTLHTTATEKPGVMFSCSDEYGLNVLYSFEGVDFIELLHGKRASRLRSIPVYLWVGDYAFDLAFYNVRRRDRVLANQKASQAAVAMGALLQDLPIRIKATNYFDETLDLPPLDGEVGRFIDVCQKAAELAETVRKSKSGK